MRDHKKLRAFDLADQLALSVYELTRDFPRAEMFGLAAQLRRAAVSAASNIVEGCARHSLADYLRFLDMAYGSVREVEYQISLATRLGYLKDAEVITKLAAEASRVLNGLIRSLRSSENAPRQKPPA
ncbi:four helix bundle protein [Planctomyces sp. SCGC AG-212-M04]|nr:four helix bundle protein [Planctomyces sp. SCGC AG-212-M04]